MALYYNIPCFLLFVAYIKKGSFMPVSFLRILFSWVVGMCLFPTHVFWINSQMKSVACCKHDSKSLHHYIRWTDYL